MRAQARRSLFRILPACLGEASQAGFLVECAAGANVVGGLIDMPVEHGVAGRAKDEVDPILVAPLHDLRAAVIDHHDIRRIRSRKVGAFSPRDGRFRAQIPAGIG